MLNSVSPCLATTLVAFLYFTFCHATSNDLDAVVVIYRHGDRTPIRPYPKDPYKNRSYWPVDWGMLTNLGKMRHYKLGQYFRQRYGTFLPDTYSEKDIYVRSTDVDRTLMSAEANLAGLYPPVKNDVWNIALPWQPIPIHSTPEREDAVLAAKKPCPLHDYKLKKLFESAYFKNMSHFNHDLYAYLTRYSGETISSLKNLDYLYNTMLIETQNNLTLPDWAGKVFPEKLRPWAALSFATDTYTTPLARLKTGPFFYQLINYFDNRTVTDKNAMYHAPKFLMFSAHDTTIASLLNTMGTFEQHCPPYTATIIFELYKPTRNTSYVNIYYKNTTEPSPIKMRGCQFNCDLKIFKQLLSDIALSPVEWEENCKLPILLQWWPRLSIYLGVALSCFVWLVFFCVRSKRRNKIRDVYSPVPNADYA